MLRKRTKSKWRKRKRATSKSRKRKRTKSKSRESIGQRSGESTDQRSGKSTGQRSGESTKALKSEVKSMPWYWLPSQTWRSDQGETPVLETATFSFILQKVKLPVTTSEDIVKLDVPTRNEITTITKLGTFCCISFFIKNHPKQLPPNQ